MRVKLRSSLILIAALVLPQIAQAKRPIRFCTHKLLSQDQYVATTDELIHYLRVLIQEERLISLRDLEQFASELEKGKFINPINHPNQNQIRAFHHEQFEWIINQTKDLDLPRLVNELELIQKNAETEERQKSKTEDKTIIPHYEMKFVPVPPGKFIMGSAQNKKEVEIKRSFWIMNTVVTQSMWEEEMGENPSRFKNPDGSTKPNHPVENITWYSAAEFANRISIKHGLPPVYDFTKLKFDPTTKPEDGSWALIKDQKGVPTDADQARNIVFNVPNGDVTLARGYILPPDEYQEYLMSNLGRFLGIYPFGNSQKDLANYAWFMQNSQNQTHAVMEKKVFIIDGNSISDVIGNVRTWSHSFAGTTFQYHIAQCGSWNYNASDLRSTFRWHLPSGSRHDDLGLRLMKPMP